ncbi:peptide chain release factor N(5)-glutamine methyltransferase [Natronospirillum operosum]|uniref:peptide chain release factor N(5)-glutamine methyltransferase n=1 Tax=Natronospirillum operosum TaxID=2759953 RepID=UPI001F10B994|nr:peptide chain release factor N(5)-glutamine methyltransferase [Natronospirillum operosum]
MTLAEARRLGLQQLQTAGLPDTTRATDVEHLLCWALERSSTWLRTWPEHELSATEQQRLDSALQRRAGGEPVAHITGHRGFWSLDLETDASTLIPRPDTETLVEAVLEEVPARPLTLTDLGTGTGAIALALARERPQWTVQGTDRSLAAVQLATRNARRNELTRVQFLCSDWCAALAPHSQDVLVSNPPYIRADDPHLQQGDLRFEPASALVAEEDGLADLKRIAQQGRAVLRAGGWLFLEHGYDQADDVALLLIDAGYEQLQRRRDLGGHVRVTWGRRPQRITVNPA